MIDSHGDFDMDQHDGRDGVSDMALRDALGRIGAQDPDTPLGDSLLLGLDTETTGLKAGKDGIVSAALVLRDPAAGPEGDVAATWLIDPHVPISPGASAVNGFTDDYVAEHGEEPAGALERIASLIAVAQRKRVPLLAYNAPFDVAMLAGDLRRWGLPSMAERMDAAGMADDAGAADGAPWPDALIVDPLVIDRAVSKRKGSHSLENTAAYYGVVPNDEFHDARTDTVASLDLIAPMTRLFAQAGALTVGDLMDWHRAAYLDWRDSFNEWARSKGRRQIGHGWFD